jgi:hypothetical protein
MPRNLWQAGVVEHGGAHLWDLEAAAGCLLASDLHSVVAQGEVELDAAAAAADDLATVHLGSNVQGIDRNGVPTSAAVVHNEEMRVQCLDLAVLGMVPGTADTDTEKTCRNPRASLPAADSPSAAAAAGVVDNTRALAA